MAYDLHAFNQDDRSFLYKAFWAGLPLSIMLLIGLLIDERSILVTISCGWVVGFFIGMPFVVRHDEFVQKQVGWAANWALGFAGLALFFNIPKVAKLFTPMFNFNSDPALILAIMAVVFHSALAIRRILDR